MITITPQGRVYLCKTPLENDYKNQLTFANTTAQRNYFNSKVVKNLSDEDFTYIKKDNIIKVGLPIDEIIDCNYLFYQNTGFTSKYYYCFITDMEYINENCTAITIETDVYQTYMFQIVKKSCFVEREHVSDDTIGLHTVKEGLNTGDFIVNDHGLLDEYGSSAHVVIGVTKLPDSLFEMQLASGTGGTYNAPNTVYNGIFNGLTYFVFNTTYGASQFLMIMDIEGVGDNVINVFLCPQSIYTSTSWLPMSYTYTFGQINIDLSFTYNRFPMGIDPIIMADDKTISINTTLDGYTPKNNKMFTREFNYLYMTNNNGGDIEYAYEDFKNYTPKFRIVGAVCPGCSIRLTPLDFKKWDTTYDTYKDDLLCYGLQGGKYPTCSWRSDTYTNWLTQNSVNYTLDKMGSVVGLGLATMINPSVAVLGGIGLISDALQEKEKRETSPVQAKGNVNVGDVTYACGQTNFAYFQLSCRSEFAQICDEYLSMFGYKVNTVKIPNTTGRLNWNYVKTIDCNFEGDIPQVYLNKIKEMFNKGVTLWHNPTTMLDYSQSNTIVS